MARPLYDKIAEYRALDGARFCMPGHSGFPAGDIYASAPFDLTEVKGLDNLLDSCGVILDSEKLLADDYGYAHALMLTCGVTSAMHVALNVIKERGGRIIAVGDMHKSFWGGCTLYSLCAEAVSDVDDVDLSKGKIAAVFVTSPDYFGMTKDITKIREFADRTDALLVIDEAHGAHFPYSDLLPDNLFAYADIAMTGMHKTLPVYGGGALLLVNDDNLYEASRRYRALVHSTSPNYLVMASMDYARDMMRREGKRLYDKVRTAVDAFAQSLTKGRVADTDDFTRVVAEFKGKDCYKLADSLADKGILVEAAYGDRIVMIVTPFNCDRLSVIADALNNEVLTDADNPVLPVLARKDVGKRSGENVGIDEAQGRISAGEIGLYPPGVPAIRRGDVLDEKAIAFIKKYRNRLFGLACGKVPVIK